MPDCGVGAINGVCAFVAGLEVAAVDCPASSRDGSRDDLFARWLLRDVGDLDTIDESDAVVERVDCGVTLLEVLRRSERTCESESDQREDELHVHCRANKASRTNCAALLKTVT